MARIFADRVKETTTTQGTGAYALAGALTACRAFSSVCAVGDTVGYCAVDVNSSGIALGGWEVGIGTFSSGNTLARTQIQASSNSNSAVSWGAGTRQIFLTVTASQSSGRKRHVRKTENYTASINDFVECDTSSDGFTVTLPPLSSCLAGDEITIALVDSGQISTVEGNQLVVDGDGANTLNSSLNDSMKYTGQVRTYKANSDLSDWIIT